MRLNPAAFNKFLDHIGQSFTWRRSDACPCYNPRSGAADPQCNHCGGKGRLWHGPVTAKAGVASASVQREWARSGMWENGDLVLAVPGSSPMWDMGQYDRVTMLNARDKFSVTLTRGAPIESLRFQVASVDRVFYLTPLTKEIVESPMPQISPDGEISWPSDGPPSVPATRSVGRNSSIITCLATCQRIGMSITARACQSPQFCGDGTCSGAGTRRVIDRSFV